MRFGKGLGARLKLNFAEPREIGTTGAAGLGGAACGFCGASCPKAGEIGPPTSVTASTAANSGRANSVFIVLLTLKIRAPRDLNCIYSTLLNVYRMEFVL